MENSELIKEYYKRFSELVFLNTKISGYNRFSLGHNRIECKTLLSILYTVLVTCVSTLSHMVMMYRLYIQVEFLYVNEVIIFLQFTFCHFLFMIDIILHRFMAPKMIYNIAEIDIILGVDDTKPLRDMQFRVFKYFHAVASLSAVVVLIQLIVIALPVLTVDIFISGLINIFTVYQIYFDLIFLLTIYFNLTLRVRYLNIALMRIVQVNPEYLPDLLSSIPMWKENYNKYFEASKNVAPENIVPTLERIFFEVRIIESIYRFTIFLFMCSIPMGTFLAVSSFIIYNQTGGMPGNRLFIILFWGISSWNFILFMSINIDLFTRQIEQTNLICTLTQLKPTSTHDALKLTKHIIRTLAVRDPRMSIYDMYYFDTGLVFRIAASIFVYVTAQIQLSFMKIDNVINP